MHAVGKLTSTVLMLWGMCCGHLAAQNVVVQDVAGGELPGVLVHWSCLESGATEVFTTEAGGFQWPERFCDRVQAVLSAVGFQTDTLQLRRPVRDSATLELAMRRLVVDLSEAEVGEKADSPLTFMNALEVGGMYRGVKSAVLSPSSQLVVDGENQPRNVFAALPGANPEW